MAEVAASLVVGPLLSLVKEKVCNSLLDQYKVMEGMEKNHEILKLKLPAILDVIADAEKQASRREVKAWLEELKKVAYVGNDVFDEFEYEALRRRAKKDGHITQLGMAGLKLIPTHNRIAFRIRMGNKLSRLVESIKVLVEQMKDFGFDKLQLEAAPAWKEWRETDSNIDDDLKSIVVASRDKEREKIIEVLLNHQASSSDDLLVIPIVGMGGLGKTTLAQLIYNDPQVQAHFQLLKWVCVSDDFNVRGLANKICNSSERTLEEALKKLQEYLSGKRYLLVLDDVWNTDDDKWRKLKAYLKQGGVGSAVLATTRKKDIAEFMGTISINKSWENRYHDVEILDKEFIQKIIETRAFSLQNTKPEELVKLVGPIAERCVGSPLAARALGSVLRNKTTKAEWEDILHRSRICDDENQILPILNLSYNDLPTNMKHCFAFCAMYPKDYQIDVNELIQLWMANGYISNQNRVPAETIGERIVSEMVSRSFFQCEEQRRIRYGSTTFVKIHDLMHDVALSASEKECVCLTDEFFESGELLHSAARHTLFQTSTCRQNLNFVFGTTRERFPPIQTMIFDRPYHYHQHMPHSSKFGSLRALSPPRPSDFSLKPKQLCHLRYLDLSNNKDIKELPDDISILYNLQTLKLSGCTNLKSLPEQMKYMTSLRHLYTDGCEQLECMPPELGRITSLQTITWFVVGSGLNCCSGLEELKDLSIGGSLMLKHLENVSERRNAKAANLENKKELRQLSLEWTSGKEEEQQCQEVLEDLKAHDGLLALGIYSYQGTSFPSWMSMLKNMVELRLSDCSKAEHLPELLGQLAELQLLHLDGLGKLQFLCSSCTSSTFGKLKDLQLVNLDAFDRFCEATHGGVVAFPQLEMLHIKGCKNLAALPEASVLREPYNGGEPYTVARSAFPELKKLSLVDLDSFERWETAALEIEEEYALLFPSLETAFIYKCPKLATLPRAPKLKELDWSDGNGQLSIGGIGYMKSLSRLHLDGAKLDDKEEWDHPSSVVDMKLVRCSLFFQPRALALWVCYGQLQDLTIQRCDELVYWPEKVFQSLISLRRLWISFCKNLIGYASENGPDEATSSGRIQLLPHLEFLEIYGCESLVEGLYSPALKTMAVDGCPKLESLCGKKQQLNQEEASSTNDVKASEEKLSPSVAPDDLLPSSLESLTIKNCGGLIEVVNLPSSLKKIYIRGCSKLRFVSSSGQLDALQALRICECPELRSLESLCIRDPEVLYLYKCRSLASLPRYKIAPFSSAAATGQRPRGFSL